MLSIPQGGLGMTATAPGGLFSSGADVSQWGYEEWVIVGLTGYTFIHIVEDSKKVGKSGRVAKKKSAKAIKGAAQSARNTVGNVAIVLVLAAAGAVWLYSQSQQGGQ